MSVKESIKKVKEASPALAASKHNIRNSALSAVRDALLKNKDKIFAANSEDMECSETEGVPAPILKRLKFDEEKLKDVTAGIDDLIAMEDPLSRMQIHRELDEGLTLCRLSCPIGVIGVIFEARPDALVQISALCLKSGNCIILKGGSEALQTNRMLFEIIYEAAVDAGLPINCMMLLEARSQIDELLACHGLIDLLIPRGSNAFVRYIMDHTKISVMGHADGICHIYVDKDSDVKKAIPIIRDSKTQYVSACNAAETLLIHKNIAARLLPALKKTLDKENVEIRGTDDVAALIPCKASVAADDTTEYLDYILSIKIVSDLDEAIDHINRFGSHHTDCILTENNDAAEKFMSLVDSAGVYQNCSTRFADGYRYGFGAEVGISTGKLHARGPVGLEGLLSYKYRLIGNGQIVEDYASGIRQFHFRDIPVK